MMASRVCTDKNMDSIHKKCGIDEKITENQQHYSYMELKNKIFIV